MEELVKLRKSGEVQFLPQISFGILRILSERPASKVSTLLIMSCLHITTTGGAAATGQAGAGGALGVDGGEG